MIEKKKLEIIFVTGNKNKLRECKLFLKDFHIIHKNIKIPEYQGDPPTVVKEKAKYATNRLKKPCFVDDTSLSFSAWKGLPGPYIKYFIEKLGVDKIPLLLTGFKDKRAKMTCYIGYCEPGKEAVAFKGVTAGKIVKPRGKRSFGFDPIFKPKGSKKTQGEMTYKEKEKISARTKALKKLAKYLRKISFSQS
jgi:inosine triphosphate pyrophosphatase